MKSWYVFILILIISSAIYANSLHSSFQYDDQVGIEENINIKTGTISKVFLKPSSLFSPGRVDESQGHYRPLVLLTYIINYRINGLNPAGYHLVNLGFHAVSAFMVFLIVKAMLEGGEQKAEGRRQKAEVRSEKQEKNTLPFKGRDRVGMGFNEDSAGFFTALAAGLIFLVHPFNSEVVNYITARSSVMSGFFYLLAFWCWIKYREHSAERIGQIAADTQPFTIHPYYIASIIAFTAGMLSKEVVITLPVVFWLYDLYGFTAYRSPLTADYLLNWRKYLPYIPFILIVIVPYLIIRTVTWGGVLPAFKRSPVIQFYTELPALVKYLRLFVFPAGLNIDHFQEIYKSFFSWPVVLSALVLFSFIASAIILFIKAGTRHWRLVSFFMFWFFIVLIPTTVIPLNAVLQENRGYLAIIVFAVFAGVLLGRIGGMVNGSGIKRGAVLTGLLLIVIVPLGIGTVYRNSIWSDGITLWKDAVNKSPLSARAYVNLGTSYAKAGENMPAIDNYRKALEIASPENSGDPVNIHYNLGTVYQQTGEIDSAVKEYIAITEIKPEDYRPYYNLGVIYQKAGRQDEAVGAYKMVLERNPYDFKSYHNLGLIYQGRGDNASAEKYYVEAVKLSPDYVKSRFNLAVIYETNGKIESARQEYLAILKTAPAYIQAYFNLGELYEREGNIDMALNIFREAQRLKPDDVWLLNRIRSLEQKGHN